MIRGNSCFFLSLSCRKNEMKEREFIKTGTRNGSRGPPERKRKEDSSLSGQHGEYLTREGERERRRKREKNELCVRVSLKRREGRSSSIGEWLRNTNPWEKGY